MTNLKSNSPNIRINKIYTRSGDNGKTRLVGGEERSKDDARVEAYGTVDELNAEIGLCRELVKETENKKFVSLIQILQSIQNELFDLGTQLATAKEGASYNLPHLSEDAILTMESEIDTAWKKRNSDNISVQAAASIAAKILGFERLRDSSFTTLDKLISSSDKLDANWSRNKNSVVRNN